MSFTPAALPEAGTSRLAARLREAHLRRLDVARVANCYRVHDPDGDGLAGLVVERFGDFAVIYDTGAFGERDLEELANALLGQGARGVYLKRRRRAGPSAHRPPSAEGPFAGASAPEEFSVFEHERRYLVRLADGPATGLFLDQRDNRSRLESEASGKAVLNLFCYTGSFSVAAGRGGARSVTSVDSSRAALSRLDKNLAHNGLDPKCHRLLRADAVAWLKRAVRREQRYDAIVLDPPTFSRDAHKSFRAPSQYEDLVLDCLRLLDSGGELLCVMNHRGTTPAEFLALLGRAMERSHRRAKLRELLPPADFQSRHRTSAAAKSALIQVD